MSESIDQLNQTVTSLTDTFQALSQTLDQEITEIAAALQAASGSGDVAAMNQAIMENVQRLQGVQQLMMETQQKVQAIIP